MLNCLGQAYCSISVLTLFLVSFKTYRGSWERPTKLCFSPFFFLRPCFFAQTPFLFDTTICYWQTDDWKVLGLLVSITYKKELYVHIHLRKGTYRYNLYSLFLYSLGFFDIGIPGDWFNGIGDSTLYIYLFRFFVWTSLGLSSCQVSQTYCCLTATRLWPRYKWTARLSWLLCSHRRLKYLFSSKK